MHASDLMTPNPVVVRPHDTLHYALQLMNEKRIRHLPVLDAHGALVGLVTDRDLRRLTPSPLSPGGYEAAMTVMNETLVEKAMVREPLTVQSDTPLKEVVAMFVAKKYGAVPVVQGKSLVGIISQIDCLRVLLKAL